MDIPMKRIINVHEKSIVLPLKMYLMTHVCSVVQKSAQLQGEEEEIT